MIKMCMFVGLLVFLNPASAEQYHFDPAMTDDGEGEANVALFNQGLQQPGNYYVNIFVNGQPVGSETLRFSLSGSQLEPCFTVEQLASYGIKIDDFPELKSHTETNQCANLNAIPQLQTDFQFNNQQLFLVVPPEVVQQQSKGIARMALWDDGIPAFLLNYAADIQHMDYGGRTTSRQFIQLQPGLNIKGWRLRSSLSRQYENSGNDKAWANEYTYITKGFYDIKSRLTLGDMTTPSDVFDSVPLRGSMLSSDDNMVPYSERSFSPAIRGVAYSQATLEIRQGGQLIYRTVTPPGPFTVTDYGAVCGQGDLNVSVRESNGRIQTFRVPCISPPIALHKGYTRYQVSWGKYRSTYSGVTKPQIVQVTAMRGLPLNTSFFGGLQFSGNYQAQTLGVGFMPGQLGGVSLDMTSSQLKTGQSKVCGQAWRLRYLWSTPAGISVTLSDRWYDGGDFYTFSEGLLSGDILRYKDSRTLRTARQTEAGINWMLGSSVSISFNGERQRYRNGRGHNLIFTGRYTQTLMGNILANLDISHEKNSIYSGSTDNVVSLSLSIPLDFMKKNTGISWLMTKESPSSQNMQTILHGQSTDRQFNWNMQQDTNRGSYGKNHSSGVGVNYLGRYGDIYGSYYHSRSVEQKSVGITGGALIHSHGVTLGQHMDGTQALVEAPGVKDISVGYIPGAKTDGQGSGIIGSLSPYQENTIILDPLSFNRKTAIEHNSIKVVPTEGAVVRAKFKTVQGRKVLVSLTFPDGGHPPFGALAQLDKNKAVSAMIADDGQVYLTGMPAKGRLIVNWGGEGHKETCSAPFDLLVAGDSNILIKEMICDHE